MENKFKWGKCGSERNQTAVSVICITKNDGGGEAHKYDILW